MNSYNKNVKAAEKIVAHAQQGEAGRIAFRDATGFSFSAPNYEELYRLLRLHSPLKYKLQRFDRNGRWVDASKYFQVHDSIVEPLRKLDLTDAKRFSTSDFIRAAEEDPQGLRFALKRIYSRVTVVPEQRQILVWKKFLDSVAAGVPHDEVVFLRTTLDLLSTTLEHGVNEEFKVSALDGALAAISSRESGYENEVEELAYSLIEGKLLSFMDRSAASESFKRATQLDKKNLIDYFYVDMGAYTYFSSYDESVQPLISEIQRSIVPIQVTEPSSSFAVLVSVDPHFFRIYASQLYLFAQQLPDLDFIFLLCGEDDEVEKAITDGESFLKSLVRLNQSGTPRNIQYLHAPVPKVVGLAQTFYACARFFAAEKVLNRYDRVYLMDADLVADDNPGAYFERIKRVTFGTATNRDVARLSPWRRILAGNVALKSDGGVDEVLPDLLGYMAHGLSMDNSWMLDQNALAFAVERHPEKYTALDKFWRPFSQPKFRSTWEKRHFTAVTKDLA